MVDPVVGVVIPIEAIWIAIGCLVALAWLARHQPCRCEKCAFHQNEARMERLRVESDRAEELARHKRTEHESWHKGGGWQAGDPDIANCKDEDCPRNKASRIET